MRFWFRWRGDLLPVTTLLQPRRLPVWVQTVPRDSSPMPPLLEWWLLARPPIVSLTTSRDGYPNRCQAWPCSRRSRWLSVESGFPLVEVWVWDAPIDSHYISSFPMLWWSTTTKAAVGRRGSLWADSSRGIKVTTTTAYSGVGDGNHEELTSQTAGRKQSELELMGDFRF